MYPRISIAILLASVAIAAAEPPQSAPRGLPNSPQQVAVFLQQTDAAAAWNQELKKRIQTAKAERAAAVLRLREGAFKNAGGFQEPEFKRLSAGLAALDAETRTLREKGRSADKDELAALQIESSRLRARVESAQAELDTFVVRYCRAANEVDPLTRKLADAERAASDYETVLRGWQSIADRYRQKPAGFNYSKTRTLTLPPPADAQRRMDAFAHRNDPASLEQLAHRLFGSLDPNARGLDIAFRLYREKRYAAALDAFRAYFFAKLVHPERYGLSAEVFLADERPAISAPVIKPEWVEAAMRGVATQPNRDVSSNELIAFTPGPPGAVNWAYLPAEPRTARNEPVWLHVMRQFHSLEWDGSDTTDGLRCWLIDGFQAIGEVKYLLRWAEYTDDWAMNMQRDLNAVPAQLLAPGQFTPQAALPWDVRFVSTLQPRQVASFVASLRGMALEYPQAVRELPAPTLARVLLVALDEYLAPNILVARATRFNWNMMGMGFNVRNGLLLGEFKSAQWAGREAARAFQNHATFSIMPDGGYVEYSDEGHQGVWLERAGGILPLLQKCRPAWFDSEFEDELKDSVGRNARFMLRHLKPDGYRHRDDYRSAREAYVGNLFSVFGPRSLDAQAPWVAEEPESRRILDTVFGSGSAGTPAHLSDVMPYLGEFMLRGGWGKDDPFSYMHSGRVPNSNEDEDCNGFKLHNYGRHLLTAQPVYVDGRTQNQHFKLVDNVGAKTKFLTYTDGQPIEGRWHTSAHFDVAEGIYEGAYEDREGRTYRSAFQIGGIDATARRQRSLGLPAVTDVQRHTRQVIFVREPVAWLVVDRVRCDAKHDYEVPFEIFTPVDKVDWLRRKTAPIPNAGKRAVIEGTTIHTDNPSWPKVELHCFSGSPLSLEFDPKSHDLAHKDNLEIRDAENEWKSSRPELREQMAFVRRTLVKWRGEGDQVLVTLITASAPDSGSEQAWHVVASGGAAFTATAPDGTAIHFKTGEKAAALEAGGFSAEADTLLVVTPRTGESRGLALGCRTLRYAGKAISLPAESVAFDLANASSVAKPIYAPIKPVSFGPNVNVFSDRVDVSMQSATPGVIIHYTVDGGEPTPQSARYLKPVRLTRTSIVKAIAVRPGVAELPWQLIPGFATVSTRAVFTQQSFQSSVKVAALTPGLKWEYLEGQPFALVANSDTLPAQKNGSTNRLMDVSMRQSGSAFTVRYDGYIKVAADGVYTFHAPREYVIPDVDPGYDLRLFVDDTEWWPTERWHALGTWSRALAAGPHRFRVIFTDTRAKPFKHETWHNWPNPAVLWKGEAPVVEISGPGLRRQPIPASMLWRTVN